MFQVTEQRKSKATLYLSNALRAVLVCVFIDLTEAPGSFLVARKSKLSSSSKALQGEISQVIKVS